VPVIQYAKALIGDSAIGEIRHVRGECLQDWFVDPEAPWTWRNSVEQSGTGSLGNLGAHTIDRLIFYTLLRVSFYANILFYKKYD